MSVRLKALSGVLTSQYPHLPKLDEMTKEEIQESKHTEEVENNLTEQVA